MKRQAVSRSAIQATLLLVLLLVLVSAAAAETWFVKPSAEVPLRRGQGKDYKIVAVLQDGTPVELLETEDPWAMVRLESGKEGWILKRYLSSEPPLRRQLITLRKEKEALADRCGKAGQQLEELTRANAQTEKELTACLAARDKTQAAYQALRQDSADVLQTKRRLADALRQLKELKTRLSGLETENSVLKKNSRLKWFLAGGGVLLVGWLIGLVAGRSRRRRSSLL